MCSLSSRRTKKTKEYFARHKILCKKDFGQSKKKADLVWLDGTSTAWFCPIIENNPEFDVRYVRCGVNTDSVFGINFF